MLSLLNDRASGRQILHQSRLWSHRKSHPRRKTDPWRRFLRKWAIWGSVAFCEAVYSKKLSHK